MWKKELEVGVWGEECKWKRLCVSEKKRASKTERGSEREWECPEYFPSSLCGPLISQAAGQPCAYRALLADSYHQTTVATMAQSESACMAKAENSSSYYLLSERETTCTEPMRLNLKENSLSMCIYTDTNHANTHVYSTLHVCRLR